MANRFTDSEKWSDPWFCELKPEEKLFWVFLLDNCDYAGFWKVNWALLKFHIGTDFEKKMPLLLADRIDIINPEKWFIKKFVHFQQKISNFSELNPDNNAHKSIINALSRCNITNEGLTSPLAAPRQGLGRGPGNGNSKGKVMVKEDRIVKERNHFIPPTIEEVRAYCKERKNNVNPEKWHNFYSAKNWMIGKNKMKDWKAAVRTWEDGPETQKEHNPYDTAKRL